MEKKFTDPQRTQKCSHMALQKDFQSIDPIRTCYGIVEIFLHKTFLAHSTDPSRTLDRLPTDLDGLPTDPPRNAILAPQSMNALSEDSVKTPSMHVTGTLALLRFTAFHRTELNFEVCLVSACALMFLHDSEQF